MNKVVIKSLIGQNGESLGAYVDYGDFCQMQSEYEEQIEKMKCCGNCKHNIIGKCAELYCQECSYYGVPNQNINKWELKNE